MQSILTTNQKANRRGMARGIIGIVLTVFVLPLVYAGLSSFNNGFYSTSRILTSSGSQDTPEVYTFRIVKEYPHDPEAFTQGLIYDEECDALGQCRDIFWESTGLFGASSVRKVDLETGSVTQIANIERQHFGEGLAKIDKLYQILWQTSLGFIFDTSSLERVGNFSTSLKDGWGLTSDGNLLLATDSGAKLYWLDLQNFQEQRSVVVTDGGVAVHQLNELEWINGEVWANIWQTDCIARINPGTGRVKAWILLQDLTRALRNRAGQQGSRMDVLNGIAWDQKRNRVFVTGKMWPLLFEISLVPLPQPSLQDIQRVRSLCIVPPLG